MHAVLRTDSPRRRALACAPGVVTRAYNCYVSPLLVSSQQFVDHVVPPGHPERAERAIVMRTVAEAFAAGGGTVVEPRDATDEELGRVHDGDYVRRVAALAGQAAVLDADTYMSPASGAVARLAAGAGLTAVEAILGPAGPSRALALVRPPGHHAERARAMGFCLFNNVAVAAAHVRAVGFSRVAVVDFDVHHGNGTQHAFYADPTVLVMSTHQHPYYPGTGAASEIGEGPGRGTTVNIPLEAGAGDADYELVFREAVVPILRQFRPEFILVSAGFDAFRDDPLGAMRVTANQFGRLTGWITQVADECSQGRVVAITEGGYDLDGLGQCLRTTLTALDVPLVDAASSPTGPAARGAAAIEALRPHVAGTWTI